MKNEMVTIMNMIVTATLIIRLDPLFRVGCRTRWSLDTLGGNVFPTIVTLSDWWECFPYMISELPRCSDTSTQPFSGKLHVISRMLVELSESSKLLRAELGRGIDLGARLPIPTGIFVCWKNCQLPQNIVFEFEICLDASRKHRNWCVFFMKQILSHSEIDFRRSNNFFGRQKYQ